MPEGRESLRRETRTSLGEGGEDLGQSGGEVGRLGRSASVRCADQRLGSRDMWEDAGMFLEGRRN